MSSKHDIHLFSPGGSYRSSLTSQILSFFISSQHQTLGRGFDSPVSVTTSHSGVLVVMLDTVAALQSVSLLTKAGLTHVQWSGGGDWPGVVVDRSLVHINVPGSLSPLISQLEGS